MPTITLEPMYPSRLFVLLALWFIAVLASTPTLAQGDPNQGPGGPIVVITNGSSNFGRFYAEILRTEGFNEFSVVDIGSVTASTLSNYDVAILAKVPVTSAQATMLTNWVMAGGNLIAMDPAPQLASLLGITPTGGTLSNGYVLIDKGTKAGAGIIGETIQFHGTAQQSTLSGAAALATLYSTSTTPTQYPAVTLRSIGSNGGQAAAFMYDLATSIVYTRQGNPAWIGQERDGLPPRRSNDLFYGPAAFDPQPNWIDMAKVEIPQADEQQRFLANLIIEMNADRKPLPRFWYLPHGYKAAVVMTGDDHNHNGTAPRFEQYLAASPPNCSLDDWECVRGTSYIFPGTPITDAQVAAFEAAGFEIGLHVNTGCGDYTQESLEYDYTTQIADFYSIFPSAAPLTTERHHCIVFSDWSTGPKVQLNHGIRLDTNYYYWPASWVNNVPGHFTGSAMPMRFADLDGSLIDVFQVVSQMTDESGQEFPFTIDTFLDRALGEEEHYGVYTVNAHTDVPQIIESDATVASAQERGVPVISARQLLKWLDARNASTFTALSWSNGVLNFGIERAAGANGLRAMLPFRAGNMSLSTISRGSTDVPFEVISVKGLEYAAFAAVSGNYVATYQPDLNGPTVVSRFPAPSASNVPIGTAVRVAFSEALDVTSVNANTIELRDESNSLVEVDLTYNATAFSATLTPKSPLESATTYTVTVRGGSNEPRVKDVAGNPLAGNVSWSFTTREPITCPCTIWDSSAVPEVASTSDSASVEVGVKFRSDVPGYIKGIRFYKGPSNTGVHVGSLWTATGQRLASATFTNETTIGWQQVNFEFPVPIAANTTYIASYLAPNGGYASTPGQFLSGGVDNEMLHALPDSGSGGNGVFVYGPGGVAPTSTWNGTNYWVDVIFDFTSGVPTDTTPPTITITAPTSQDTFSTDVATVALSGNASDNSGTVTEVTWSNDRGGSGTAVGTSAWSVPAIPLQVGANTITVTARDFANNAGADTIVVTYTPPPDLTPPTITGRFPAAGALSAAPNGPITVTFSEPMNPTTINSSTIELRDSSNQLVATTVSYEANVATIQPASALAASNAYTVTVRGGATDPRVKDLAGNALPASETWSFTTAPATTSLWSDSAIPAVASNSDSNSVELGVKFRSDVAGYIVGIRFYKGAANTGPHVGNLWTASGQLLGSVTFTNESASGWQQANFDQPIAIEANTTYVASYFAPNGRYALNTDYFMGNGVSSGVLHAPTSDAVGGNGVFAYASASQFPNETYSASNYWVDVAFAPFVGPDTTPPTVSDRSPASGATNVPPSSQIRVVFSEPMDASTINNATIVLRNASNEVVPASVSYAGNTATLVPTTALASSSEYTVTVHGGASEPRVKDAAGNALAANVTWSFTTGAATITIWPSSASPAVAADPDPNPVELGVKFRSDTDGYIVGIRFYKGPGNSGPHTGTLWNEFGGVLGTVSFQNETESGWQQADFAEPIPIQANTTYIASYYAPNGRYSVTSGFFATSGADNGVLHAPANAVVGGNGVFSYGAGGGFPTESWEASNYWVDVAFAPSIGPDTNPPTIANRTPPSGATNVPVNSPITITFSEALDPTTVNTSTIELRNASNQVVPATVSGFGNTATLIPTSALANSTVYTVSVRGGAADPRVKDAAGNALASSESWSFTTAPPGGPCVANAITAENCLTGNSPSEWDVSGAGDPSIQGFATEISVNRGSTVYFKVKTDASNYRLDIYRMGYYGGLGARKIATVQPSAQLPQIQPNCLTQAATGLIDCGNWAVSASWTVPANAVSGIYFAKLVRADTGGSSHIFFIVRNDSSTSDIVFQTSDTTWQAYNNYGGNSLYVGSPGSNPGRAYAVSYNRPFNTRAVDGGQDWVFNAEYPMVRWLEANGYDVTYISGVDTHRNGSLLMNHRAFLSVGHDEYWSKEQRANVEAARDAGVNLAFFSGNEVFWKIRWENSIDGSGTPYRTMVSYKETHAGAKIDPSAEWTGTWRDPRFSPPGDGGYPENALTGTIFTVNSGTAAIVVPAAEGKMRFWRNTSIASLAPGQSATLPQGTLGYEWDSDLDNGFRPPGLIRMSDTTVNGVDKLQDYGSTYATDTANHALTLYKHASGALVFGAGTVQWSWGLDATHDRAGTPADPRMQQATVNLFADMGVQPATLQPGLIPASPSTDSTAPTAVITAPTAGQSFQQGTITISGTATDAGGGVVGGVEVSTDGGLTWRRAVGRSTWTYSWVPNAPGSYEIRARAVDDSGNIQTVTTGIPVTVTEAPCPCSIWPSATPSGGVDTDPNPIELGTRFRANTNGVVTAIRFYKVAGNNGPHVGSLWSENGTLLGQVTFENETASGWQTAVLPNPVPIVANAWYVVSYHTSSGVYIGEDGYFATSGVTSGPLYAPQNGEQGPNGVFKYSPTSTFPDETYASENYWVDVVFERVNDATPPSVTITSPTSASTFTTTVNPFTLGGTASDAVGVTQVTWSNNRGGSGTASGTTSWTASGITLLSGTNVLTVTARDAAGNTATDVLTVTYNPDTTAPTITITSPTSNSTYSTSASSVTLAGTASDAVGVTSVTWTNDRGGSGTASGTTSWSTGAIALQTGANVITVTARDAAGNTRTDVLTVTRTSGDTTAPTVTIQSPTSGTTYTTNQSSIALQGTASDNVGVTQVTWSNSRGGSGTASGTTNWSVGSISLQTGSNVITIRARDAAGNSSTDVLTVTRDTTAPSITINSPTSNSTYSTSASSITLGGTASDSVGLAQVTWTNSRGGSGTASGTTSWSTGSIALQAGSNVITVTARDTAGNTSTDVITVTRTTGDTQAPTVTITAPTSSSTYSTLSSSINLRGTASDNVGVTQVTWSNNRGGSGTASGTTSWNAGTVSLQRGTNVLTVTARDAAGNTSTDTLTVNRLL